jgi:hypothetical protein
MVTDIGGSLYRTGVNPEVALNSCRGHLLTTIGPQSLYPLQAARIKAIRAPKIILTAPWQRRLEPPAGAL